jgi:AraC family transcriptional regulator
VKARPSPVRHLSRLFRQRYGVSFQNYVLRLRLEKAAELLQSTQLPVARVALRVGYRDVSRFGQHFRRSYRCTPSAWRARIGDEKILRPRMKKNP